MLTVIKLRFTEKSRGSQDFARIETASLPSVPTPQVRRTKQLQAIHSVHAAQSHLLRDMSVPSLDELKNCKCERGKVTQRPPIAYAQYKYKPWIAEPNKI